MDLSYNVHTRKAEEILRREIKFFQPFFYFFRLFCKKRCRFVIVFVFIQLSILHTTAPQMTCLERTERFLADFHILNPYVTVCSKFCFLRFFYEYFFFYVKNYFKLLFINTNFLAIY